MLRLGANVIRNVMHGVISKPISEVFYLPFQKVHVHQCTRNSSFLVRAKAEDLWKSLICVSNAGKRRGRGQKTDRRFKKDLNKGQKLGEGKVRMVWPGLTSPVLQGNTRVMIQKLDSSEKNTESVRPTQKKRKMTLHPLERGWTGKKVIGRRLQIPKSEEYSLGEFEAVAVEHKLRRRMTPNYGTTRFFHTTVVVGNKNGLIGLGKAVNKDSRSGLVVATKSALKALVPIHLEDNVSINHDFFSKFGSTEIFAFRKPEGYGLKCQRLVRVICELLGIKNISVNIEGSTNEKTIYKAFISGLLNQKTHEQIAKENKLYVVEKVPEKYHYPKVLGVPDKCISKEEFLKKPLIFKDVVMGGKTEIFNRKKTPFYVKLPSYQNHLKKVLFKRNHDQVKTELRHKYGELTSHLGDIFPECRQFFPQTNKPKVSHE